MCQDTCSVSPLRLAGQSCDSPGTRGESSEIFKSVPAAPHDSLGQATHSHRINRSLREPLGAPSRPGKNSFRNDPSAANFGADGRRKKSEGLFIETVSSGLKKKKTQPRSSPSFKPSNLQKTQLSPPVFLSPRAKDNLPSSFFL